MMGEKDKPIAIIFDWGDGHMVEVKKPDLKDLPKVTCPVDCFPEGETGTGKVVAESSQ